MARSPIHVDSYERVNREYHRVLEEARSKRARKLHGFDTRLFLQLLALDAVWIDHEVEPIVRSRDPNDDHFLTAAMSGYADFLVTGDLDLLVLDGDPRVGSLRIVTPRAFADGLRLRYS